MSTRAPARSLSRSVTAASLARYLHAVEVLREDVASSTLTMVDELEVDRSRVGPSALVSRRRLVTRLEVVDAAGTRGYAAAHLDLLLPELASVRVYASLEEARAGRAVYDRLPGRLLARGTVLPAPSNADVAALDALSLRSVEVVREVRRLAHGAGSAPVAAFAWTVLRPLPRPELEGVADVATSLSVLRAVADGAPLGWALRHAAASHGAVA